MINWITKFDRRIENIYMQIYGTIRYSKNPIKNNNDSWWVVVDVDCYNLCQYYRHLFFLATYKTKKLSLPIWGEHITINYGKEPLDKTLWGRYDGMKISVSLSKDIGTANAVYWFPVLKPVELFCYIRTGLGLLDSPINPFHLCLGYLDSERKPNV